MSSLTTYNALQVVTPDPTGTGGLAINNNFKKLSTYTSTSDPGSGNDSSQGYAIGSRWFNTSTAVEWICVNSTVGAAVWNQVSVVQLNANGSIQIAKSGGNARGSYAADIQSLRIVPTQVASGPYSFVAGRGCTASGFYSTATGGYCTASAGSTASGSDSTASGYDSVAQGLRAIASGFGSVAQGYYVTASGNGSASTGLGSTASGQYSTASGYGSTASGSSSTVNGCYSTASGMYSTSSGYYALASKRGQTTRNSFAFSNSGDNQQTLTHLGTSTANATPTELTTDGNTPSGTTEPSSNRFLVTASKSYGCLITVLARKSDGTTAYFVRQVVATNVSGTVSIGTVTTVGADTNPSSWGLTIQADNTNKSLQVLVTGAAATNIRWRATVRADEVIY